MRVPKGYRPLKLVSPVQQQTEMAKRLVNKRGRKRTQKKKKTVRRKGKVTKVKKGRPKVSKRRQKSIKGGRKRRKDIFS